MKINLNRAWAVGAINFRYLKPAYIITCAMVFVGVFNLISCFTGLSDNYYVDMGNYLYILVVFAPIFISARNFKRIMHLSGKKLDYYWGCLINYIIIAAVVSLSNIVLYSLSRLAFDSKLIIQNLIQIFGWMNNGVIIAFLQQFCFLLLVSVFVHTLTEMQDFWFGWVTDVLLVAVISVFIPIPMLRNILIGFFNIIIFNWNALVQIVCCLLLTVCLYTLDLQVLRRKRI